MPSDYDQLNSFLNYQRDTGIPKHRLKWNWLIDLPVGQGQVVAGNAGKVLDKFIGGWQLAGIGSLGSTYFTLPTGNWNFTGEPIQQYGYQYPIENCTSGTCIPGYLWWNGYIPRQPDQQPRRPGKAKRLRGHPRGLQAGRDAADSLGHHRAAGQRSGEHQYLPVLGHQQRLDPAEKWHHARSWATTPACIPGGTSTCRACCNGTMDASAVQERPVCASS